MPPGHRAEASDESVEWCPARRRAARLCAKPQTGIRTLERGTQSEPHDSHTRYAGIPVSWNSIGS